MTPTPTPPPTETAARIERLRQWKYRLTQSLVFGIPVFALHFAGPRLGGPEAARWIGLLESLLSGWVLYVGGLGMIGDALLRRRWTIHAAVAIAAIVAYGMGIARLIALLVDAKTPGLSRGFVASTALIVAWSAIAYAATNRSHSE
jgi:cation transport ATPase